MKGMKMIVSVKKRTIEQAVIVLTLAILAFSALVGITFTSYDVFGGNITNITVRATVNVSNTEPVIIAIRLDDNVSSPAHQIDLTPNGFTAVVCNATIFDYNGWADIAPNKTNATLYIKNVEEAGATDKNFRYRNSSCGSCRQAAASEAHLGDTATTAICDCKFNVQYYANNSNEWVCNMSVTDTGGTQVQHLELNISRTAVSNDTLVNKLLAIDTGTLLDYGNLSVTETSSEIIHNVTNVGNINLNITLRGYGGSNESIGINHSMMCDFGNISVGQQKYALGSENIGKTVFVNMTILRNQTDVTNFTLYHKVNDNSVGDERNSTIWRLQVPLSVGGICNGTIIFGAVERID